MLSENERNELERRLLEYERTRGHQVVVHTTPSLEGLEIEDYSIAIAEAWKVGHRGLDNGVILTVAPNERKVRIEVGYGLEGVVPDAIAFEIQEQVILPRFREGELAGGITDGVDAILAAAAGEYAPARGSRRSQRERGGLSLGPLLWILILFLAFGSRGIFFLPFLMSGSRGGSSRAGGLAGGGFGGGGGFSGGGGGFGGGGASGSW